MGKASGLATKSVMLIAALFNRAACAETSDIVYNASGRSRILLMRLLITSAAVLLIGQIALAQNLTRDTIPQKWIEPLLPEDLPKLKAPEYATPVEQAKMQIFAGRYKLGLNTLKKIKDGD